MQPLLHSNPMVPLSMEGFLNSTVAILKGLDLANNTVNKVPLAQPTVLSCKIPFRANNLAMETQLARIIWTTTKMVEMFSNRISKDNKCRRSLSLSDKVRRLDKIGSTRVRSNHAPKEVGAPHTHAPLVKIMAFWRETKQIHALPSHNIYALPSQIQPEASQLDKS